MTTIIKMCANGDSCEMNSTELINYPILKDEYDRMIDHADRTKNPITYWTCFYSGWIAGRMDMLGKK